MKHELKTWPVFFAAILSGRKTAEMRKNDRNFAVGDELILREYGCNPVIQAVTGYTGREKCVTITHVLTGEEFGVKDGFACLSFK